MGWFSSSYKINVFTSVSRVVEDSMLPETIEGSMLEAILRGDDVTDAMMEASLNNPSLNFNRMFDYAKKEYPFGLPNSTVSNSQDGKPEVTAAIESDVGQSVTLSSMFLDSLDRVFIGWKEITENYGYDHYENTLNILTQSTGHTVYLDKILAVYKVEGDESGGYFISQNNTVSTSGYTPERPAQAPGTTLGNANIEEEYMTGTEDGVMIKTVYQDGNRNLIHDEIFIGLGDFNIEDAYFHAKYTVGGETRYWLYQDNTGEYPALDEIHNARHTNAGTFFPFIFFRHHSKNRTHSSRHDTEQYKASKEMLDIINMDYQDIGDNIHDNEDVDDIEQATMLMGIPINSQNSSDLRYLYLFFSRLADKTTSPVKGLGRANIEGTVKNNNAITVQDADFKFVLSYGNITKRLVAGKLGKPGTHTGGLTSFKYKTVQKVRNSDEYQSVTIEVPQRYYRRQVNQTLYEEVKVTNPKMSFVVYETGSSRVYDVAVDSEDDRMLIPLDKNLADTYSLVDQEELYYRSLHLVVNSKIKTKVEWYQTGIFKVFMIAVAVGIFILFPPGGTPALMAALGVGSSIAAVHFALAVLFYVLQGMIISYTFKLIVRELGVEDAFIVALVFAVIAIAAGQIHELAFISDHLVMVASGLTAGVQGHTKDQMEGLRDEHDAFGLEAEDKWEELEEVNKLLDVDTLLDPFAFVGLEPLYIPTEGPEAFFHRTIDSGNIGTVAFQQVENYVDNSLRLPTITDTLGDEFYV